MEGDTSVIIKLCLYTFFKEFRPSEPFLSPYLNETKNLTDTQILNEVYPVGTYSHLCLLILIFLLTDWLKYKPIILVQAISGVFTYALLIYGNSIPVFQVVEVLYGLFCASDVAWNSYMYCKVKKENYQKATAQTKAMSLISKTASGFISQMLLLYGIVGYIDLNYMTLTSLIIATLCCFILPNVSTSYYFHREKDDHPSVSISSPEVDILIASATKKESPKRSQGAYNLKCLFSLWKNSMKNRHTLKWSLWYAFSLCGYLQVTHYIQLLWQDTANSSPNSTLYNGFSNCFNSLAGAVCTYGVGYLNVDWTRYGEVSLAFAALIQAFSVLAAAYISKELITHYALYAVFKIFYQATNTIASSEIAKSLESESYGLIFSGNQFFGLVFQSILTVFVIRVFGLHIRTQFMLYGIYFALLGVGFVVSGIITIVGVNVKQETRT